MNRSFTRALVVLAILASGLSAQEPADRPAAQAPTPAATAGAAQAAADLRHFLSLPPEKLVAAAQELGQQTLADLHAGRPAARLATREKNVEALRGELLAQADRCDAERIAVITTVETEIAEVRQQFADNPAECGRQVQATLDGCRAQLQNLKQDAEALRQQALATDGHLRAIRPALASLTRQERSLARLPVKIGGHALAGQLDLAALDLPVLPAAAAWPPAAAAHAAGGTPQDPIAQALAEWEQLKK